MLFKSNSSSLKKSDSNKKLEVHSVPVTSEECQGEENENPIESNRSTEQEDNESVFEKGIYEKKESVFQKFCFIIKEKVFLFTCISITTLLFISTAIIFWAPDYALNVLKGDHNLVLTGFVVIALSGPVLGIIIGGAIVQKFAGGYEGKNSIVISLIFACLAFTCSLPFHTINQVEYFGLCLWGVLFFGGCVIPNLQGIMISSLKNEYRAAGNSVSNILQNAIGFLPAPVIYGFIFERTKNSDPKAAMQITLSYSLIGILLIVLALYYRNFKYGNFIDEVEINFEQKDERNEHKFNQISIIHK